MIHLGLDYDLPLNVHSRSAGRPTIQILQEVMKEANKEVPVILHAFDGRPSIAKSTPSNFYFSVPPSIVRSEGFRKLVETLPIERMLLETGTIAIYEMIVLHIRILRRLVTISSMI